MPYERRCVCCVRRGRKRVQYRTCPFVEVRRRAEGATEGAGFDNNFAIDLECSGRVIGCIAVREIRSFASLAGGGSVDRSVARSAVAGAGSDYGAIWTQHRRPNLEAATTGFAA